MGMTYKFPTVVLVAIHALYKSHCNILWRHVTLERDDNHGYTNFTRKHNWNIGYSDNFYVPMYLV